MPSVVEMLEQILPEDWEVADAQMGSSCLLLCPCGEMIEQDGECPEGHVSPLVEMGMI